MTTDDRIPAQSLQRVKVLGRYIDEPLPLDYTADNGKTYTGALASIKRWEDLESDYRWGIYDLGDLKQDTGTAPVILRPDIHSMHRSRCPWTGKRARYAAKILTDLGFYTVVRYRDGGGWEIKVTRYAGTAL